MNGLEVTVLLGVAVLAAAVASPRLRVAPPLLLVLIGLGLGAVPELRSIQLPPETVLLVFLPVLLFWESLTTSLRAIKRDFRGIVILSTLLVAATAFGVAALAHLLGMPWGAALVLGAALAPPDATAAAALGRTLPRRQFMLLKAESLTNDGTALVLYAIAVGVAGGEHYSPLEVTGLVALSYGGGVAAGAITAAGAYLLMRRLQDPTTINIALLLTPFVAYLLAELVDASGVLAVVVAGLGLAFASSHISTAASRRQTESSWPLGSYLLNGSLFVLIGLEAQAVAHDLDTADLGRLTGLVTAAWVALLVIRFVFPQLVVLVIRAVDRRPAQRARRMSYRARVVGAVAGFRGAVSLAIALSVPTTLDDGTPFPARDDIVLVTAGVILLTLLVQGPLLPVMVRWADLPADDTHERELGLAEHTILTAALAGLSDVVAAHHISRPTADRVTTDYSERLAALENTASASAQNGEFTARPALVELGESRRKADEEDARLRLALLARKRDELSRLRRDGSIDDAVARRVQTRLDLEELRLIGVEPLD